MWRRRTWRGERDVLDRRGRELEYTANSAFDNLNVGQTVSDTVHGGERGRDDEPVKVTINGTNDAAVVSSDV